METNSIVCSHLPGYLEVIMGVLWARLNHCDRNNWQHGTNALRLLETLLLKGSPRVAIVAMAWLPLLRHLVLPTIHSAALAGEWLSAATCA